jgi:hypothetical protein
MKRPEGRPLCEIPPPPTGEQRKDLRRLVALEWTQTAVGVGLLVAVVARAVFIAEDDRVAAVITIVGILSMLFLTMAFRIRMGHESLRRDIEGIEIRHELANRTTELHGGSPYRDRFTSEKMPPLWSSTGPRATPFVVRRSVCTRRSCSDRHGPNA